MVLLKKLIFSLPFLAFLGLFFWQIQPFFQDFGLLFSFSLNTLYLLLLVCLYLILTSFCFVVFAALANDWKLVLPAGIAAAFIPVAFIPLNFVIFTSLALFLAFLLTFLTVHHKMKAYLTFQASTLFSTSIKTLTTLIILATSISFYLSVDKQIKEQGFKIPEALIDTALQFAAPKEVQVQGVKITQAQTLTQEQIELLKQNPELLKQHGIDPSILDSLPQSLKSTDTKSSSKTTSIGSNALVKNLLESQLQKALDPYIKFVPIILVILFFVTFQSLTALLMILLPILISLIFLIFEKTNFIHFEKEMREVKKMVV